MFDSLKVESSRNEGNSKFFATSCRSSEIQRKTSDSGNRECMPWLAAVLVHHGMMNDQWSSITADDSSAAAAGQTLASRATAAQRTRREREFTDDLTKHIRENGSKIQMGGLRQSLTVLNTNSLTGVRG